MFCVLVMNRAAMIPCLFSHEFCAFPNFYPSRPARYHLYEVYDCLFDLLINDLICSYTVEWTNFSETEIVKYLKFLLLQII